MFLDPAIIGPRISGAYADFSEKDPCHLRLRARPEVDRILIEIMAAAGLTFFGEAAAQVLGAAAGRRRLPRYRPEVPAILLRRPIACRISGDLYSTGTVRGSQSFAAEVDPATAAFIERAAGRWQCSRHNAATILLHHLLTGRGAQ